MPTWGWFVVALVIIDLAVVAAWFLVRHRAAGRLPRTTIERHPVDPDTQRQMTALVQARKPAQAMALLRERTGMPLRQAKDTVDAADVEDRGRQSRSRTA